MAHEALASRPAFKLELTYEKPIVFDTMAGQRGFFRVVESKAGGERFSGKVIDDGGDWIVFRPDGVIETDSRMMLQAADGALVYMRSRGVIRAKPEQLADFKAGKAIDLSGAYYRVAPYFDAPVGAHDWLTKSLFVATGTFSGRGSVLDIHEIL
ncbi:MAG: DUF3237 family protein [Rhizobiaceae bacterium]|nr:DUF3237 family protein [Rhizobiaceae bacterium]